MKRTTKTKSVISLVAISMGLFWVQNGQSQNRGPWVAPNDALTKANPFKDDKTTLKDAKTLYLNTCGPCHGEKGKGDGIAAVACDPKPANHTSDFVQKENDGTLFWKISEGRGPMPSYKKMLTVDQRWQLVNYIRTLKEKK